MSLFRVLCILMHFRALKKGEPCKVFGLSLTQHIFRVAYLAAGNSEVVLCTATLHERGRKYAAYVTGRSHMIKGSFSVLFGGWGDWT